MAEKCASVAATLAAAADATGAITVAASLVNKGSQSKQVIPEQHFCRR